MFFKIMKILETMSTIITSIYSNNNIEITKQKLAEKLLKIKEKTESNGYKVNFRILHNLYTIILTKDKEIYSIQIFLRDFYENTLLDIFIEDKKDFKDKKYIYRIIEGDIKSWNQ